MLFSQFENLLNCLAANLSTFEPSQNMLQERILSCWDKLVEFFEDNEEGLMKRKKLKFLREQFSLASCENKTSRRYSPEMMVHWFMMHKLSPACYKRLRENSFLTLPHEQRLVQLSGSFGVAVDKSQIQR